MISFLFWNLDNNDLRESVSNLVYLYQPTVIILAENIIEPGNLLNSINLRNKISSYTYNYLNESQSAGIDIFPGFSSKYIKPIYEEERISICKINLIGLDELLLISLHLPSKLYKEPEHQRFISDDVNKTIRQIEKEQGHNRTIVIGDFNMDPFEPGLVNAKGFHAVRSKFVAEKIERTISNNEYPMFYNPIWKLYGNVEPDSLGTYYYWDSAPEMFFWNMLDQVIIRPSLLKYYDGNIKIINHDGENSLVDDDGIPRRENYSDHLPLFFSLNY